MTISRDLPLIACVSWMDANFWPSETLRRNITRLCPEQPYAPSPTMIEGFLQSGGAVKDVGEGMHAAGKGCLLLEYRDEGGEIAPLGAALWSLGGGEAELEYLIVSQLRRREGWGRVLMERSHRILQDCGVTKCVLEVSVANRQAIGLYENFGYLSCGRRPRYYADGQDALIMVRADEALSP